MTARGFRASQDFSVFSVTRIARRHLAGVSQRRRLCPETTLAMSGETCDRPSLESGSVGGGCTVVGQLKARDAAKPSRAQDSAPHRRLWDPSARGVEAEEPSRGQRNLAVGVGTKRDTHVQGTSAEILSQSALSPRSDAEQASSYKVVLPPVRVREQARSPKPAIQNASS